MRSAFSRPALVSLTALMIGAAAGTADASWRSSILMGENQGYCKDGRQHADVRACPENRRGGGAARAPKHKQPRPALYSDPDN